MKEPEPKGRVCPACGGTIYFDPMDRIHRCACGWSDRIKGRTL